ncbi:hypothetical protein [Pseudomonas helleri]|uniref:hypothetical protein n=1 Tax=Pseudomonas helleri TaxID=1608996 RepID=UPI003FD27242
MENVDALLSRDTPPGEKKASEGEQTGQPRLPCLLCTGYSNFEDCFWMMQNSKQATINVIRNGGNRSIRITASINANALASAPTKMRRLIWKRTNAIGIALS